ncbi:MAG TPA: efflux RND transporter periplasmic adaptor subunit, partial [Gammaproteobacteria bacterium]
ARWPLLLAALLLAACQPADDGTPAKGGKRERQPQLVETVAVQSRAIAHAVTRTGTLRANRVVQLFNQEEGQVAALPFSEGDQVAAGTLVARLDDTLLRAQLDKAEATRRQAASDLKRLQSLKQRAVISDDELNRAETALQVADAEQALLRARLGYSTIRAPFDGIVAERKLEPGDVAPRFTHLLTLYDPGSLVIEATLSELLLAQVAAGDRVPVRIDALGEATFPGHVVRIHPTIDPRTRLGTLEIALDDPPPGARPGQLGRVALTLPASVRRVIPYPALRRDTQGEYVFRVAEGKVRRVAVRSGLLLGDEVEIVEGLADGEPVVLRGFLGLNDGTAVREATPGAAAQ